MSICGIVLYGEEYIKSKKKNIDQWKMLNPDTTFYICTVDMPGEGHEDYGIPLVVINNTVVNWYRDALIRHGLPIHILSDILRWYALHHLRLIVGGAPKLFMLEGDVICSEDHYNWMAQYPPQEGITVFGTDRACMVEYNGLSMTQNIIGMFENIYIHLIVPRIFGGNYIYNFPHSDFLDRLKRDSYYKTELHVRKIAVAGFLPDESDIKGIEKSLSGENPIAAEKSFLEDIPYSIQGIGILTLGSASPIKFHRPYTTLDLDPEREKYYIHQKNKSGWVKEENDELEERNQKRITCGPSCDVQVLSV